jgi:DnaJ-domain-containing protein 1
MNNLLNASVVLILLLAINRPFVSLNMAATVPNPREAMGLLEWQ